MDLLTERFFARTTLEVARDLLGTTVEVRGTDGRSVSGRIVETEAYGGPEDPASHAARGATPRSQIMFGPPGRMYIYLIYGRHHCLNFVTEKEGTPGAVLIRAIEPVTGEMVMAQRRGLNPQRHRRRDLGAGPGKLCQALGLDLTWNGMPVAADRQPVTCGSSGRLVVGAAPHAVACRSGPRIGVSRGIAAPFRFVDPDSDCLSR